MKVFGNKEDGFSGTLTMTLIVGVLGIIMAISNVRARNEIDRQIHNALEVGKTEVKVAIQDFGNCPKALPPSCTTGQRLLLRAKDGQELVTNDGSKRIGPWNVKIECTQKAGQSYWVYVAQLVNGQPQTDPFNKKLLDWAPLFPLKESCGDNSSTDTQLLSNVCYGGIEGKLPLPKELRPLCPSCVFTNRYCGDEQVPFPACPAGYKVGFRYLDRYGWGGIDLTKYTLCKKVPS